MTFLSRQDRNFKYYHASGQYREENASFSLKGNLKVHIASVHERKKSYVCESCKTSFSTKDHLKRHIASVHERKKPHRCESCKTNFSQKTF